MSLSIPGSLTKSHIQIPKTIQDALEICKRMNERYLWVDSLCIIQDEGDPENASNIAHMGSIYGEAIFTIVAADSPGADGGIQGVSTDRIVPDQLTERILDTIQLFLPIDMQQKLDPWETRAWTFQEKLLSKRMLVFANGYAVWRCRGAIWREDVNALDSNSETASFPWLQLLPVPKLEGKLQQSGLEVMEADESVRLFRLPAFHQYVKIVEDFSGRDIGEPWKIMDAFKGLQRVLESPKILHSTFRFGLPVRFMDAALLWQPSGPTRRREEKLDQNGNILRRSPPSWSWAGWESAGADIKGAKVTFNRPYEVEADSEGLFMRTNPLGEERIRPLHRTLFSVADDGNFVDFGLLHQRLVLDQISKDWSSYSQNQLPDPPPRGLSLNTLTDRYLVFHTEVASLWLGNEVFRVRRSTMLGEVEYIKETIEDWDPFKIHIKGHAELEHIVSVSTERQIIDAESSKPVGTIKLNSAKKHSDSEMCVAITAMVLSEAQHMGNEKRVDVLGYPVYNIMAIMKKEEMFAERVGLGKIYKFAWKKAAAKREVIVLE
jgi:Heterokaryon incompatibility protein (HET)